MAMRNTDFAVFILTHGRPDRVDTYKSLTRAGYTGKIYFVIDNEDKDAERYYQNFGDSVIMFDKAAIAETFDEGDNFGDRRAVIYARNACFDIARNLGITYFMEFDDDYTEFLYRINSKREYPNTHYIVKTKLDELFDLLIDYYKSVNAKSIAMAQGGDFIGGRENDFPYSDRRRKCMNTFICSTERPFQFVGRINEDVNTYTWLQSLGNLFYTVPFTSILQRVSQSNTGGMTEMYLDSGTYIKSFYTVMYQPSSVTIEMMNSRHPRLHHSIKWDNTVPCIISEQYRKSPVIQAVSDE